jgi:3-methyladenine DNA glycosylase AlkC
MVPGRPRSLPLRAASAWECGSAVGDRPAREDLTDASPVTRVGARRPDLVSVEVRALLERGAPSVNHMEQMAFDMGTLFSNVFPDRRAEASRLRKGGLVGKMRTGGEMLFEAYGEDAWANAASHESDTVRGWGAMAVGACRSLSLSELFTSIEPYADDPHFAVREWAWLAVRSRVVDEPRRTVELLIPWTSVQSRRLRRFASEATRPRGVWSAHVPTLKREPELAEELLMGLRADPSGYVQDSVGNWLNDASKTRPDWVEDLCASWLAESKSAATRRICRRGMRTLKRSGAQIGLQASL